MKRAINILLIVIFAVTSCEKYNAIPEHTNQEKFVPGDLLIGITDNADLKTVFDTLNSLNFQIAEMNGFFYNCNLTVDSVTYLINLLNQKPYINTGKGWSATTGSVYFYTPENSIRVLCSEFNMTSTNQLDFLSTIASIPLNDNNGSTKDMVLKIPIGSERYWLNELKKYTFIKWTELNTITQFLPD